MGMAASQARFLGLTARKSNVEYQGQQVNQQRSSLANESAGLFNQMTALKVPLPPSAVDFYSSRYTFQNASASDFALTKINLPDGSRNNYEIEFRYSTIENKGFILDNIPTAITKDAMTLAGNEYAGREITAADKELKAIIKMLNPDKADSEINFDEEAAKFIQYTPSESAANQTSYFVLKNENGDPVGPLYFSREASVNKIATGYAELNYDTLNTERFASLMLTGIDPKYKDDVLKSLGLEIDAGGNIISGNVNYDLEIKRTQDELGYEQAMKDYEFEKMMYERSIQDINARTETIQAQDKSLELKLRQLDTEQKAIQTEMEAVQKVIQKNVETTFKTFA